MQKTAKINSLKLSGKFETCEECDIAKARQKNVSGRVEVKSLENEYI
jgi:hypothetical protein